MPEHDDSTPISPNGPSAIVELLRLAGPTVAQMASYTLMQFIDTWMLSRLGATGPTAAGNAGLFAFSLISLGVGTLFVVNTLVSQSYGRRDFKTCGRYLGQGIWFSIAFAIVLLPFIGILPAAFKAFGHEPALIAMEDIYLRIVLANAVFKLLGTAFSQFLLATNRPGCVLASTLAGVSVNAVAAWILIFNRLGIGPHGIAGAAWAQNIGVVVEMLACIAFVMRPKPRRQFNALDWRPRTAEMMNLITIGLPAGVQFIADVLAWSLFCTWVMAAFGTTAMAANTFMFRYMVVSFMPAFGVSAAVTALVGRYIGMGRPDIARERTNLGFIVTAIYMVTCGLLFYLGGNELIGVFTDDPEVRRIGAQMLAFAAVYQFFDAVYIVYNGALRGAGDTFVPAAATGVLCWGITVFGARAIAMRFPRWGPAGPWTAATIYGAILGLFIYARFYAGGWQQIHLQKNPLVDFAKPQAAEAEAGAGAGAN
jgi:multidrug resistance protein, MATE family